MSPGSFRTARPHGQPERSQPPGERAGGVPIDKGTRALYATDGSNYRQAPLGVVLPRTVEDVIATVHAAREHGAPVCRGARHQPAGQYCNTAVVMDMSRYLHHVREIDPARHLARVEPGTILDDLRRQARAHGLTFGPDPATHTHCTLGGMIGNNSCGIHSVMAGRTVDNVERLDVLTWRGLRLDVGPTGEEELKAIIEQGGERGEIYRRLRDLRDRYAGLIRERYPSIPRRVSGYNLDQLLPENGFQVARALVGTEATCVTVLEATVRLVRNPGARSLVVLGYPDVYQAGDAVPFIMEHQPIGLEGIDDRLVGYMRSKGLHPDNVDLLPDGRGWLLVEFGGDDKEESDGFARRLMQALEGRGDAPSMKLFDDEQAEAKLWEVRESGLGATAVVPGEARTWPGWEDAAVPPESVGDYLRDFRALLDRYGYECALYGHFGQGCIHVRIDFDLRTRPGIDTYLAFIDEAADLVVSYGGSLSGEHGDGQSRGALLPKMFGEELVGAFREFKAIWDPDGMMNPGKVVDPAAPDEHLRLGTDYDPHPGDTAFAWPHDNGSFAHATLRCVGVGKCRRLESDGTMCPSYMVTREEQHSTRGRARLLFEMLQGDVITDKWKDRSVHEALDLCLACKGCLHDCPVNVDMATYKAEFYSHYYRHHLRPRDAWAFGLIPYWARLAAPIAGFANAITRTPGLSAVAHWLANVAPERNIPAFAKEPFTKWFHRRARREEGGDPVFLYADTFNNYFHPDTARAAVQVLETAGCEVHVPSRWLCCGRPLYEYGMVDRARGLLRRTLDGLRDPIRAGMPVVVLEPSCLTTFHDELPNLFPNDEDARRLSHQAVSLGDFLAQRDWTPPALDREALFHGHCHQKAVLGYEGERTVLDRMGVACTEPETGCCGMAGAFGFTRGKYGVSVAVGERHLLPAIREAPGNRLVLADGFSCRAQISQCTGRKALHFAEVIGMGLEAASSK